MCSIEPSRTIFPDALVTSRQQRCSDCRDNSVDKIWQQGQSYKQSFCERSRNRFVHIIVVTRNPQAHFLRFPPLQISLRQAIYVCLFIAISLYVFLVQNDSDRLVLIWRISLSIIAIPRLNLLFKSANQMLWNPWMKPADFHEPNFRTQSPGHKNMRK